MWFLAIGVALLVCKLMDIAPVANWAWWQIAIPFGLAVAWWAWADATGYTKRKAMEAEQKKKKERQDRQREELGLGVKKHK